MPAMPGIVAGFKQGRRQKAGALLMKGIEK